MKTHEILGLEPYERFEVKGHDGTFMLDSKGAVRYGEGSAQTAYSDFLAILINDPDRIIHRTRLTEEQVKMLKAMPSLYLYWLVKNKAGQILSYQDKPKKNESGWTVERIGRPDQAKWFPQNMHIHQDNVLDNLVSWDDSEPLNILKTLRDAGARYNA